MQLLRGSLISAISWRSGNESLALKIAFGAFFSLGLFSIIFYACSKVSLKDQHIGKRNMQVLA